MGLSWKTYPGNGWKRMINKKIFDIFQPSVGLALPPALRFAARVWRCQGGGGSLRNSGGVLRYPLADRH